MFWAPKTRAVNYRGPGLVGAQLCIRLSGFMEHSWSLHSVSAFRLPWRVFSVEVPVRKSSLLQLGSRESKEWFDRLFTYSWIFFLDAPQNLTSGSFPKISCIAESKTVAMKVSYSIVLKPIAGSYVSSGSLTHADLHCHVLATWKLSVYWVTQLL